MITYAGDAPKKEFAFSASTEQFISDAKENDWVTLTVTVRDFDIPNHSYIVKTKVSYAPWAKSISFSKSSAAIGDQADVFYSYMGDNVDIQPITIYWGCFGRDVRIHLADQGEKPASEVNVGDRLLGQDNEVLIVNQVYTGYDTEIFEIVTQSGNTIRVSGGHPMMCHGKMVRASRLNPGDCLNMANGTFDPVEQVSVVPYKDTVYNFTFEGREQGAYLIANGLYTGDLFMQNETKSEPQKEWKFTPEEKQLIAEMVIHNEELKAAYRQTLL